jgi:hypothetical protein
MSRRNAILTGAGRTPVVPWVPGEHTSVTKTLMQRIQSLTLGSNRNNEVHVPNAPATVKKAKFKEEKRELNPVFAVPSEQYEPRGRLNRRVRAAPVRPIQSVASRKPASPVKRKLVHRPKESIPEARKGQRSSTVMPLWGGKSSTTEKIRRKPKTMKNV